MILCDCNAKGGRLRVWKWVPNPLQNEKQIRKMWWTRRKIGLHFAIFHNEINHIEFCELIELDVADIACVFTYYFHVFENCLEMAACPNGLVPLSLCMSTNWCFQIASLFVHRQAKSSFLRDYFNLQCPRERGTDMQRLWKQWTRAYSRFSVGITRFNGFFPILYRPLSLAAHFLSLKSTRTRFCIRCSSLFPFIHSSGIHFNSIFEIILFL